MEFFRIQRDIPFMRHALVFNVISLVTFVLAVVFLAARGLNFGIDFRGGTLIAGIALLLFGSGPVRGFAVVHCLGILTSMFSAVLVSRGIVNLIYGSRKKLEKISIGQVWKPGVPAPAAVK